MLWPFCLCVAKRAAGEIRVKQLDAHPQFGFHSGNLQRCQTEPIECPNNITGRSRLELQVNFMSSYELAEFVPQTAASSVCANV